MRAPREQDLVKQVLQYLRLRGALAWRCNNGAVAGTHNGRRRFVRFTDTLGVSDIVAALPPHGRLLALECKRPGRTPTPAQQAFLTAVAAAGGLALVITDVADLVAILDREGVTS
jgi:hypothetical protein